MAVAVSPADNATPEVRAENRGFGRALGRFFIYAALCFWAFVCLFPIFWVVTTSFKSAVDIYERHIIPFRSYEPSSKGWDSILDTIGSLSATTSSSTPATRSSSRSPPRFLATVIGSLAAYGLTRFNYKFGPWRNRDISFWFLSQLILPPVALAMPLLVLYRELNLLDSRLGLILIYTIMNLPIVIWIMRDQFNTSRSSWSRRRWSMARRSGRPSPGSSSRSPVPVSSPPSFSRSSSPGTSTSSPSS